MNIRMVNYSEENDSVSYTNLEEESEEDIQIQSTPSNLNKGSFSQILINLFKSNFGIGITNMPQAILRGGILFGPLFCVIFIIPITHCMFLLLKCTDELKKRSNKHVLGYAGTVKYSLIPYLREKAKYSAYFVNILLVSAQLGFCTAYFVFTAQSLNEITGNYFKDNRILISIICLVTIFPAMVSRLDIMSILSGISNVCCIVGLSIAMYFPCKQLSYPSKYPLIGNFSDMPLFFSSLVYSFEGINTVIPMYNEIKDKQKFPLALIMATLGCGSSFILVGLIGYIAYGAQIKPSIIFNIPYNTLGNTARVIFSLGIFLTYFIQFHVAMSAIMPTIEKFIKSDKYRTLYKCLIRAFLVILTGCFAIAIPGLDNVITLIGAISCNFLGLIIPCVVDLTTFWDTDGTTKSLTWILIIKNIFIITSGVILSVAGVFTTVRKIILEYKH